MSKRDAATALTGLVGAYASDDEGNSDIGEEQGACREAVGRACIHCICVTKQQVFASKGLPHASCLGTIQTSPDHLLNYKSACTCPVCAGEEGVVRQGDGSGSPGAASEEGSGEQPLLSLLSPGHLPEVRACLSAGSGAVHSKSLSVCCV